MPFSHEKVTNHFGHIFPTHVEALCELLIVLRQQFFGDLDLMLILAIIGSRALPARQTSNMTYAEFISDNNKKRADQPINIQSIAECSGIPRETVRRKVNKLEDLGFIERDSNGMLKVRKVNKLEDLGFIERDSNGMLKVTDKAIHQLKPATEASLHYLIALGESSTAAENQKNID